MEIIHGKESGWSRKEGRSICVSLLAPIGNIKRSILFQIFEVSIHHTFGGYAPGKYESYEIENLSWIVDIRHISHTVVLLDPLECFGMLLRDEVNDSTRM